MNIFLAWWQAATPAEREQLAIHCKSTAETLRQDAHAYRTQGRLRISLGRAAHIASGTKKLERKGLPALSRESLNPDWKEIDEIIAKSA